jgi:hypothetical protein
MLVQWVLQELCSDTMLIFQYERFNHEVYSILSFNLNHKQLCCSNQDHKRNTMHKYTRSIMGNPSQQGKKT